MHLVTVHYVLSDLLCSIGAANMPYTKLEPIHVQNMYSGGFTSIFRSIAIIFEPAEFYIAEF